MTSAELYESPFILMSDDFMDDVGWRCGHFPEIPECVKFAPQPEKRLVTRRHAYRRYDSRRYWELKSWRMDGKPFMVTRNAGREGDDHVDRWVTDAAVYREAVNYIFSLVIHFPGEVKESDEVPASKDLGNLLEFYGERLVLGKETPVFCY